MNKNFIIKITVTFLVFVLGLAFYQFYRIENINEYISPKTVVNKNFETMSESKNTAEGEKLQVYIYEDSTELSQKITENLLHSLKYAKVPFEQITGEEIKSLTPSPYNVLVLTGENVESWPYDIIRSYVENGGRLVFTNRFLDTKWNELVGIENNEGYLQDSVYGLNFEIPIFPGYPNLDVDSGLAQNSVIDVTLNNNAKIYITAEETPILWTNQHKKGKVVYWNATMLDAKNFRGLLLHSLGLATPAFVTSQVASKVVFIDDFPSPVPEGTTDSIKRDYDLSISEFYKKIWWEDMKQFSKQYDLTYTGVFIGTYRDDTKFDSQDLIKNGRDRMTIYGRQILENNGEIGIHGYNHQSLVTKSEPMDPSLGYRPWESQAQMEQALNWAKKFYNYYFPNQTFQTYVPPSNVLNKTGVEAIINELPNIHTIASLYVGSPEKGDFVQEFEIDKKYPNIYHFPRITSDYNFSLEEQFIMNDAIANFGMVSHFIHPDDVLDPNRSSGNGWPKMSEEFENQFKKLKEHYPYLEPLTAEQARNKMIQYQKAKLEVSYTPDYIYLNGNSLLNPSNVLVRVEEGKKLDTGKFDFGEVEQLDPSSSGVYVVKLINPEAKITIKENLK